jgi:hypothetical protein
MVAPPGVEIKGPDVTLLGQEPTTKSNIYSTKGPDLQVRVEGTGLFNAPSDSSGTAGSGQNLAANFPKLYGLLAANASFLDSLLAVKWVLLTILGMLALGFILLYRKGDPLENPGSSAASPDSESDTATKASRHARGRG